MKQKSTYSEIYNTRENILTTLLLQEHNHLKKLYYTSLLYLEIRTEYSSIDLDDGVSHSFRFRMHVQATTTGDFNLLNPLRSWLEVEKGSSLCRVLTLVVLLSAVVTGPISLCWVELLAVSFCFFANFLRWCEHIHANKHTCKGTNTSTDRNTHT